MQIRNHRGAEAVDIDAQLLLRSADGDTGAFDALVDRNRRRVINLIYRQVGDADEAEDLAQEAFVRLYMAQGRYRPTARFSTFLHRIVVNLCLNEARRRRRRPAAPVEEIAAEPVSTGHGPEELAQRAELATQVMTALQSLPDSQRMAVVLSRYGELSYRDIADAMDCSVKAVEGLLHRAGQTLARRLADYLELDGTPAPAE